MGKRQCELEGCSKPAITGGTPHCKAHGGGKRCQHEGCPTAAVGGGTPHCKTHGGGRRCQQEGCSKSAQDVTEYCIAHGGGKRCQHEGCSKTARGGAHCVAHGGGRRCQQKGCSKSALTGGTPRCMAHGGGRRCQGEGCAKSVAKLQGSVFCTLCVPRGTPQPPPARARSPVKIRRAPPTAAAADSGEEREEDNDDDCNLCGDGGRLICCSFCVRSFHLKCLDLTVEPSHDAWACPRKLCQVLSLLTTQSQSASTWVRG
jgi:hypothetical protein